MSSYHITIKDMPEEMRPREKMLNSGEHNLTEEELLAIILGSGNKEMSALQLARELLVHFKGLRQIKEASLEELISSQKGIGTAKAIAVKAAMELGRRSALHMNNKILIQSPEDVKSLLMEDMRYYDREHFRVLYLDRKGGLLTSEDISIGGLHSSLVHPREVFKTAVKRSASSLILVHNHPSGDPKPSKEDIEVTERLLEAGKVMGIEILDHIIIGEGVYFSLKAKGLI